VSLAQRIESNRKQIVDSWRARTEQELSTQNLSQTSGLSDFVETLLDRILGLDRQPSVKPEAIDFSEHEKCLERMILETGLLRQVLFSVLEKDKPLSGAEREVIFKALADFFEIIHGVLRELRPSSRQIALQRPQGMLAGRDQAGLVSLALDAHDVIAGFIRVQVQLDIRVLADIAGLLAWHRIDKEGLAVPPEPDGDRVGPAVLARRRRHLVAAPQQVLQTLLVPGVLELVVRRPAVVDHGAVVIEPQDGLGHGAAAGPMGEAVDNSLSQFASEDVRAVVAYLRTVPPAASPDLPATLAPPAPASPKHGGATPDALGKKVFEGACVSCHDWTGVSASTPCARATGRRDRESRVGCHAGPKLNGPLADRYCPFRSRS